MTHESIPSQSIIDTISARLDEETSYMSGGFANLEGFQEVVSYGEDALRELLSDMNQPGWWRMQAIWTIAHNIGNPIEFSEQSRGKHDEIRDTIVAWGVAHGYVVSDETPTEAEAAGGARQDDEPIISTAIQEQRAILDSAAYWDIDYGSLPDHKA